MLRIHKKGNKGIVVKVELVKRQKNIVCILAGMFFNFCVILS